MPRYDDQPDYGRAREAARRDNRDVRRPVEPTERRPPMDRDYQMDDAMDIRMDPRTEPRAANTSTRMQGPVRGIDPRGERDVLYRDPRTGELYRDAPSIRRTPYENEFDDMLPSSRPIVVSAADPGQPRASYAEYFLPGEGIEREVIQAEICRYLGQDATCRPGKNPSDGRPGFLIKAYRALTTEMIRSLQESSNKFRNEEKYWADKDKRRRRPEVSYTPIQDHQYDRDMDMDDDDARGYMQQDRYNRDIDPRDPRGQMNARPGIPVTSGYLPDPGFPAYAVTAQRPDVSPMAFEPRTFTTSTGNTTPPTGFRPTAYSAPDFPPRTAQPAASNMPAQAYLDPRTGKMMIEETSQSTSSNSTKSHYPAEYRSTGSPACSPATSTLLQSTIWNKGHYHFRIDQGQEPFANQG